MQYRFLLWLNALVFCVYLVGHLFDILIIVPNWNSGSLADIQLYNDFFQKSDPRFFFSFIRPFSIATSFVCLMAFWSRGTPIRALLLISLLIDILIYAVTQYYFRPINEYLFLNDTLIFDPAVVKDYVSKWVAYNYIRIALITVGFYASLRAIHFSYRQR